MVSSVSFQAMLYYHAWFSGAYALVTLLVVRWKVLNYDDDALLVVSVPLTYGLWAATEAYRLYQGYKGNLREHVASLAAFLFLTVFPQLLLCGFFATVQKKVQPVERVLAYLQLVFLAAELVLCYRAMNRIIANNTARFAVEYAVEGDDGASALPSHQRPGWVQPERGFGGRRPKSGGRALSSLRARSPAGSAGGAAEWDEKMDPPTLETTTEVELASLPSAAAAAARGADDGLKKRE